MEEVAKTMNDGFQRKEGGKKATLSTYSKYLHSRFICSFLRQVVHVIAQSQSGCVVLSELNEESDLDLGVMIEEGHILINITK
jgi:hypothetical protein